MNRNQLISWLTTNVAVWKGPGGREALDGMPDAVLAGLKNQAEHDARAVQVANAAVEGFTDGGAGKEYRLDPETGTWQQRPVSANARKKGDAGKVPDPEVDDPEDLIDRGADEDEEDAAGVWKKNRQRVAGKTNNTSAEDDPYEPPPRRRPPQTADEWLASAPEPIRNKVRAYDDYERREKETIISKLLQNVGEADRPAYREWLMQRSLEQLNVDLKIHHTPSPPQDDRSRRPAANRQVPTDDGDVLYQPTIDWSSVGGDSAEGGNGGDAREEDRGGSRVVNQDLSEDEQMSHLPPSLRARVQQADVVINRERRKLIEEVVADLEDEEDARVLRNRLQHKSLEELRDLRLLASKRKPSGGANYFGASPAPLGNTGRGAGDLEDVLPLPTMDFGDGRKAQ
jgi:hypothetical protein